MKKLMSRQSLLAVGMLFSSPGFASTVTVTPSNAAPHVGDTFTLTVSGAAFPDTVGATLILTFDSAVVRVLTPTLTAGIVLAPASPFTGGIVLPTGNAAFVSGGNFSVLAPLVGILPSGNFAAFQIVFTALALGNANIVLVDDQADFSWTNAATFTAIPATYTQANVTVTAGNTVNITGSLENSEASCTQTTLLSGAFDCTYSKVRNPAAAGGWSGPGFGGGYYAVGSAQDSISYVPDRKSVV